MDDLNKLVSVLPAHWQLWGLLLMTALPLLGRAYHALINGGGIVGVWRGVVFGTNTPTAKQLSLFLLAAVIGLGVGCKATPAQISYRAAGVSVVSVEEGLKLWKSYEAANPQPLERRQAVAAALAKYKAAAIEYADANLVALSLKPGDASVPGVVIRVTNAEAAMSQAGADFVALLKAFGVVK